MKAALMVSAFEQRVAQPTFDPVRIERRRIAERFPPLTHAGIRHVHDRGRLRGRCTCEPKGTFEQCCAQLALRIETANEHDGARRLYFVWRVRQHYRGATCDPSPASCLTDPKVTPQGQQELHTVMTMQ